MVRYVVAGVALAIAAACSLPSSGDYAKPSVDGGASSSSTSSSGDSGGAHDSGSAPASEAGAEDAGFDAAGIDDLLMDVDSTFENGKCGQDTGVYQSVETSSSTARSGSAACQVCRSHPSNDDASYSLDTQIHTSPQAGRQYTAMAWVRAVPNATDSLDVTLTLRTHNGNFKAVQQIASDPLHLTSDYHLLKVVLDVTTDTSDMDYFVSGAPPLSDSSPCFLIDDVYIWQSN